jgi:hypothetical protein
LSLRDDAVPPRRSPFALHVGWLVQISTTPENLVATASTLCTSFSTFSGIIEGYSGAKHLLPPFPHASPHCRPFIDCVFPPSSLLVVISGRASL